MRDLKKVRFHLQNLSSSDYYKAHLLVRLVMNINQCVIPLSVAFRRLYDGIR